MTMDELNAKKAEIRATLEAVVSGENQEADVDALAEEMKSIDEQRAIIEAEEAEKRAQEEAEAKRAEAEQDAEIRQKIADGLIGETKEVFEEEKTMTNEEIRGSQEYVEAFARYLVSEDERECRALLTDNAAANGQLPVPTLVDTIIRTAWENDQILSRVRKTAFKGNLKVPFERAVDPAYEHLEGSTAITEEDLTLGVVELKPVMIKKFIRLSDEIVAIGGEPLVRYIYNELAHQIIKLLSSKVIGDIAGAGTSHSASAIGIPKIGGTPSLTIVPEAEANLTDEATDVVVIINRLTSAAFNEARVAGNFAVDPYDGLPVLYTSALPAYSTASDDAVWMIVGDLNGAQVNYPEGEGIINKWDDLSEAEADMVKVHGRQYAGHGVTGPGRFVNVKKAAAVTT